MPAQAHEAAEVQRFRAELEAVWPSVQSTIPCAVLCSVVADDAPVPPGCKKVHFIRHGQGFHNVAQQEWRNSPSWDGVSEPYTLVTDPEFKLKDPVLTPQGEAEAIRLQERTLSLEPEILVVSPMNRATQTGLLAWKYHVAGGLKVIAHELVHEISGKHTCDCRLSRSELSKLYPGVNYDLIDSEEDPYWGDGQTREGAYQLALRGAQFLRWLQLSPNTHIAVAAHSAILFAIFNGVLTITDPRQRDWFSTGEMRTVMLEFVNHPIE